jgi:hypothetical protein
MSQKPMQGADDIFAREGAPKEEFLATTIFPAIGQYIQFKNGSQTINKFNPNHTPTHFVLFTRPSPNAPDLRTTKQNRRKQWEREQKILVLITVNFALCVEEIDVTDPPSHF